MYKLKQLTLTGILCLSACGTSYTQQGMLNFNVAWPQPTAFAIQVIPDDTQEIVLQVFNAAGTLELEERLERGEGEQRASLTLSIGKKELVITARNSNQEILAESRSSVDIKAGQVSQVESELIPLAIGITPMPSPPGGGSSNNSSSSSPNPAPNASTQPLPDGAQSPLPDNSPSPNVTPTPQPTPTSASRGGSSGGSGGGSGGSSSSGLSLTASPESLSGMGYSTFVSASAPAGAEIESITWSCTPPSGGNGCGQFEGNTPQTIWKSPQDNPSFGESTVTSVRFVLTANAVLSNGTSLSQSIEISINRGNGTVALPSGPPNAGEFDGGN
jgi:hypothetical protein